MGQVRGYGRSCIAEKAAWTGLLSHAARAFGRTAHPVGRLKRGEDGLGFQLVPWQPVLEKRLDQHISGVRRADGGIEWSFSRNRQIGLGM